MVDKDTLMKVMLTSIRKIVPQLIAEDLVSVQPMTGPVGQIFTMPARFLTYQVIIDHNYDVPEGYNVVMVNHEISMWIETHNPISMWKYCYDTNTPFDHYIISDELLTWLKLKWA